jgi:hypothetical protein
MLYFCANMRYVPKGLEFFAKVTGCKKGSKLFALGFRTGDIVQCVMLDEQNDTPEVLFKTRTGEIKIRPGGDENYSSLVEYAGQIHGLNFIEAEDSRKAQEILRTGIPMR